MIEIRKTAVSFVETELIELERIVIDDDADGALTFLKRSVYHQIEQSQKGHLRSHLDSEENEVKRFSANNSV